MTTNLKDDLARDAGELQAQLSPRDKQKLDKLILAVVVSGSLRSVQVDELYEAIEKLMTRSAEDVLTRIRLAREARREQKATRKEGEQ